MKHSFQQYLTPEQVLKMKNDRPARRALQEKLYRFVLMLSILLDSILVKEKPH